jgi:hypothetical protein
MNPKKQRTYLLGFLIFLGLVFAFDRGLFFLFRTLEANVYKKKSLNKIFIQRRDFNKQFLRLPEGTYSTLIMGSSRTHRGIHPYYFYKRLKQKAFKIAKAKIRLKFNYYFYKEYKKYAGIPRVVVYGLDYFMFRLKSHPFFMNAVSAEGEDAEPPPYADGLLLLLSNKAHIDDFFNNYLDQLNRNFNSPAGTQEPGNEAIHTIDPFIGYEKKVYKPLPRKKRRFRKFNYGPYPGKEGIYFTKLLKEWEKDGVRVILVFLPDYIGTYESNYQLDLFKREIQQLSAPYENVFIYDYNRPDKFPLSNPKYFLDGGYGKSNSHLSKTGARVFNRTLLKDIRKHYEQQPAVL